MPFLSLPLFLLLRKIAWYLIPALLLLALGSLVCYKVYLMGKQDAEREYEKKEKQILFDSAQLLESKEEEIHQARLLQLELAAQLQNKDEENAKKLKRDLANMSSRGLYVAAPKCPAPGGNTVRRADGGSAGVGGAPDRVRLSGEDEQNLAAVTEDAQRTVEAYERLRQLVLQNPKCFRVVVNQ